MRTIDECHKNDIWIAIVTQSSTGISLAKSGKIDGVDNCSSANPIKPFEKQIFFKFIEFLPEEMSIFVQSQPFITALLFIWYIWQLTLLSLECRKKNTFSVRRSEWKIALWKSFIRIQFTERKSNKISNMLVQALVRPLVNNICKVPSRSTSAIIGKRTNNVSVAVSIKVPSKSIGLFSHCCFARAFSISLPISSILEINSFCAFYSSIYSKCLQIGWTIFDYSVLIFSSNYVTTKCRLNLKPTTSVDSQLTKQYFFIYFQERAVLGGLMISSMLFIPGWVLLHLEEYKAPKD